MTHNARLNNPQHIGLFRRTENLSNTHDGRFDLSSVEKDKQLFTKPTLLCCGGIMCNAHHDDGRKNANGFAKIGYGLLGLTEEEAASQQIDVVTTLYPQGHYQLGQDLHSYTRSVFDKKPLENTQFAAAFAKEQLLPLVQDEAGNALDVQTAQKHMRNVNVVAMSYGAAFMQQVGNVLADEMERIGYSAQEIHDITSQVLVMAAGPTIPMAAGKASFTTVNMLNFGDTEITNLYPVMDMLKETMASQGMLVEVTGNKPVAKPDIFATKVSRSRQLPKQSLTTMPISLDCRFEPSFHYDEDSRNLVVCATQPMRTNAFGDIIQKSHITRRMWRSDEYGKFDVDNKNIIDDSTGHQPHNFYNFGLSESEIESGQHGFMLRTINASVLVNGMNNAIENAKNSDGFTPLPAPAELLKLPQKMAYILPEDRDFTRAGEGFGYSERIKASNYSQSNQQNTR